MTKTFCDWCEEECTSTAKNSIIMGSGYEVCEKCKELMAEMVKVGIKAIRKDKGLE